MYRLFRRRGKFSWTQIIVVIFESACTSLGSCWNIRFYVRIFFVCQTLEEFCHYSIWIIDRIKTKHTNELQRRNVLKSYRLRSLLVLLFNNTGCYLLRLFVTSLGSEVTNSRPFLGGWCMVPALGRSWLGPSKASSHWSGEIQLLSNLSFVLLMCLVFSVLSWGRSLPFTAVVEVSTWQSSVSPSTFIVLMFYLLKLFCFVTQLLVKS